ncbi:ParA family protein [Chlorobium phaeovibrioides]|uniref:Chromosome segregation ATPase n=1 Tax=Chlorobium phaeovibrioides (strain DSM 265 / 1930) TaxID=290318 RepID=A4SD51_CHLPM|nr:AAA family ATPase [Chlorobium phaeovibrioides]RTY36052.1 ParA family protein [Chlorobium phaeovibrioides]HCD36712.1 ParA family protein [Chlorobium sp.]
MGRVIAIANQKGGVGKTTTAVNIAASLAVSEFRTLLIDIDPQANATSGFGIDVTDEIDNTFYQVMVKGGDLQNAIIPSSLEYLDVLPSNVNLVGMEVELVNMHEREYVMQKALRGAREQYDYIIIDCPPSLGLITLNSLTAADSVLIPVQAEYYALEGLGKLLNTISIVRKHLNPNLEIEGVLVTMFDSRLRLATQVDEEVRKFFKDKVYRTHIRRNVRLSEAPSHGKPALLYDAQSIGSKDYLDLVREIFEKDGNIKKFKVRQP